jgi:S1-C subfamily serine protease
MKYVLLLILLTLAGCAEGHPREPSVYERADEVSFRLEQDSGVICSGWAIGHHAIVTDEHCIEGGVKGWRIDGRRVRVSQVLKDGNDHVILITDLYFRQVAKLGPVPQRGDEVFTLGNPDGQSDILLRGHVAGFKGTYVVEGWGKFYDITLIDSNDWKGCSGAAVFDSQGRVIGVVNAIWPFPNRGWKLAAAFGLRFTPDQYTIATNAGPQENWVVSE